MEAGIVGLPNVGKSTLFNALTSQKIPSENYPFCTIEPNVGVVTVPDSRLGVISKYIPPQKLVPALLQLVDIAGIVRGASEGEGLGNKFLSHIRTVDAIIHVVRCFEDSDVIHVEESGVDPIRDIETIETELMLADLQTVVGSKEKAAKFAKGGDKEAKIKLEILLECEALLKDVKPVRTLHYDVPDYQKIFKSLSLLSSKKVLYIANVHENDLHGESPLVQRVRDLAKSEGSEVIPVCAKLEAELSELDPADRQELLESVGLQEPALNVVTRAAYKTLGLQSFFTAGRNGSSSLDDSRRSDRATSGRRDSYRFREGVYSRTDLFCRRPRPLSNGKGHSRSWETARRRENLHHAGWRYLSLPV